MGAQLAAKQAGQKPRGYEWRAPEEEGRVALLLPLDGQPLCLEQWHALEAGGGDASVAVQLRQRAGGKGGSACVCATKGRGPRVECPGHAGGCSAEGRRGGGGNLLPARCTSILPGCLPACPRVAIGCSLNFNFRPPSRVTQPAHTPLVKARHASRTSHLQRSLDLARVGHKAEGDALSARLLARRRGKLVHPVHGGGQHARLPPQLGVALLDLAEGVQGWRVRRAG